jgi:hypothetical protein
MDHMTLYLAEKLAAQRRASHLSVRHVGLAGRTAAQARRWRRSDYGQVIATRLRRTELRRSSP